MTEDDYEVKVHVLLAHWPLGSDPLPVAKKAVRTFPNSARMWLLLGDVIKGKWLNYSPLSGVPKPTSRTPPQEALDAYRRATEVDPRCVFAWEILGNFYQNTENPIEAEKCRALAAQLKALRPAPKFSQVEIVRIRTQPPNRRPCEGELGTVTMVDYDERSQLQKQGEYVYSVDVYRCGFSLSQSLFRDVHLESLGAKDGLYTDEAVGAAAVRGASLAISHRQLYLCTVSSLTTCTPGVAKSEESLVADLPRRSVACGCMDPMHQRGDAYAEVFNEEIVRAVSGSRVGPQAP